MTFGQLKFTYTSSMQRSCLQLWSSSTLSIQALLWLKTSVSSQRTPKLPKATLFFSRIVEGDSFCNLRDGYWI